MKKKRKLYLTRFLAMVCMIALAMTSVIMGAGSYTEEEKNLEGYDPYPVPTFESLFNLDTAGIGNYFNSIDVDDKGDYLLATQLRADSLDNSAIGWPDMPDAARSADRFVMKTQVDENGNIVPEWTQTLYALYNDPEDSNAAVNRYPKLTYAEFNNAVQLTDGSYVAVGSVFVNVSGSVPASTPINVTLSDLQGNHYPIQLHGLDRTKPRLWLVMHMQENGEVDYVNALFDGSTNFWAWGVAPTSGGGFVVTGASSGKIGDLQELYEGENASLGSGGAFVIKYNKNNAYNKNDSNSEAFTVEMMEKITTGVSYATYIKDVIPVSGGYILSGTTDVSQVVSTADAQSPVTVDQTKPAGIIMKIDESGKIVWLTQAQGTEYRSLILDGEVNIVAAGVKDYNAVVTKLNQSGDIISERVVEGSDEIFYDDFGQPYSAKNSFADVEQASDGGYLLMGYTDAPIEGDLVTNLGGQSNINGNYSRFTYVIKTDADFSTEGTFIVVGEIDEGSGHYNKLVAIPNGFVVAGTTEDDNGDFKNLLGSGRGLDAYAAQYTYDSDGDGIVNTRDYYIFDSDRYLPHPDDEDYKVDLNKAAAEENKFNDTIVYRDLLGMSSPVENVQLSFNGAVLTAPGAAFDTIFKGINGTLKFQYILNDTAFDVGNNKLVGAFDIDMLLNEAIVTSFGTYVKITVPLTGITDSSLAKLFYVNEGGALRLVAGAEFTSDSVTFITDHFSTYVVAEALAADDNEPIPTPDDNTQGTLNASGNLNPPSTGDSSFYLPVAIICILSAGALCALYLNRRKRDSIE